MSSGRAAKTKKDECFKRRTVATMAAEMASIRRATERACIQFEALAKAQGVKVDWDEHAQ